MTSWKSQTGNGAYAIQFETSNYALYKMVEKACQKAIDKDDKDRAEARAKEMAALGHL